MVQTTYAEAELVEILKGHDAVVSTVGATGFSDQKVVIDAAIKAGVQRFIPSELSMNTLSKAVRELVPVFEAKKVVLNYLKEKESTGLTWTGLAGGPLLDWAGFMTFTTSPQLIFCRVSRTDSSASIFPARQRQFGTTVRPNSLPATRATLVELWSLFYNIQKRQPTAIFMCKHW